MKILTDQRLIGDEISIATGNTILIDGDTNEPIVQMIDEDYREMIASAPEMLKALKEINFAFSMTNSKSLLKEAIENAKKVIYDVVGENMNIHHHHNTTNSKEGSYL